jgi:hypothetical protein
MKCPHCLVAFNAEGKNIYLNDDNDNWWFVAYAVCPECKRMIIYTQRIPKAKPPANFDPSRDINDSNNSNFDVMIKKYIYPNKLAGCPSTVDIDSTLVHPKGSSRPPCPSEVPKEIAEDYNEACLVLPDSPKASAALSRRCLQTILQQAGFNQRYLSDQIEKAMSLKQLPLYLIDQLDAVRNIGNFAAHPSKSQSTGEIVPVEPHEAEWNLDIIEALFEHYYVLPVQVKKKREALDEKLKDTGQKPMK